MAKRASSSARRPSLDYEHALHQAGYRWVAGVDEAGRGAWAGPVVAAAVLLPLHPNVSDSLSAVNDSKRLSPAQRAVCRQVILHTALAWAVGSAAPEEIDTVGIVAATRLAMQRAIAGLSVQPDALLIDALKLPDVPILQRAFNFADSISLSVAAASILAKTERDRLMQQLDAVHPGYGFAQHKGYGTRAHQHALRALGVSPAHRRSFRPVAEIEPK
ncbi:MAG: ribonuclease HII [Anaerolineae bacterium]|nr:ribonuclease HII [Thermoflexales bacterium]MDW8408123.1 ribonuclease HII [Anaerolineae bacterium]